MSYTTHLVSLTEAQLQHLLPERGADESPWIQVKEWSSTDGDL